MSTLVMVAPKQAIDQAIKEGYPQRAGGVLVGGVLFKAQAPISFSQDGLESMNDREMLELAAKAAGYEVLANKQAQRDKIGYGGAGLWIKGVSTCWNPLADDGDALRLAVRLRMEIDHNHPADETMWVSVRAANQRFSEVEEFDDEIQREASTRRAIVRAPHFKPAVRNELAKRAEQIEARGAR